MYYMPSHVVPLLLGRYMQGCMMVQALYAMDWTGICSLVSSSEGVYVRMYMI